MRSRAETDVLILINKINKPKLRWRLAEYKVEVAEKTLIFILVMSARLIQFLITLQ